MKSFKKSMIKIEFTEEMIQNISLYDIYNFCKKYSYMDEAVAIFTQK